VKPTFPASVLTETWSATRASRQRWPARCNAAIAAIGDELSRRFDQVVFAPPALCAEAAAAADAPPWRSVEAIGSDRIVQTINVNVALAMPDVQALMDTYGAEDGGGTRGEHSPASPKPAHRSGAKLPSFRLEFRRSRPQPS
jgi:hypothetical protein